MSGVRRCAVLIVVAGAAASAGAQPPRVTLTGYARLAPETLAPGPPSGAWTEAGKEGSPQFLGQPVQGFSAIWPADDTGDAWWTLVDNGFGAKINSADALLRIYRVRLTWATAREEGRGRVAIDPVFIQLADRDRRLPFPIVRGETRERWLTGADLDPESFVRMPDGSFWIGDEFGPFVLHVSAAGAVLGPPAEVAGLRSPDHPHLPPADAGRVSPATVARSRGFESLAAGPGLGTLYAALETPAFGTPHTMFAFDPARGAFSGESWSVPIEEALTELVGLEQIFGSECAAQFLGIARDNAQGAEAKVKRLYEFRLTAGKTVRTLIADLLDVLNPEGLGGHPLRFAYPYITTEAVWPTDRRTLVLVNDNNFPGGGGRPGEPRDATEFIRLRLPRPLCGG